MDKELRDWIVGLSVQVDGDDAGPLEQFSDEGADYLEGLVTDGTLRAAFSEFAATEPELAD